MNIAFEWHRCNIRCLCCVMSREIGGDTTKLQTALKGVNTEIRNTQAQLKDVEKLLKLDPVNTELLAQKHRLLGNAVKETKEKLETLKTAAEQAEKALNDGTISKDQYYALQSEIIETENELKRLEEQANQSATALQKISATGEKLKDMGSNIEGAARAKDNPCFYEFFSVSVKKNSRLVQTKRTMVCQVSARARDRPPFFHNTVVPATMRSAWNLNSGFGFVDHRNGE